MAAEGIVVYKTRDMYLADLIAALLARIPDANTGTDSIFNMLFGTLSGGLEGISLGQQLLHDDMWPQTASALALQRFGDEFGRSRKAGTPASGNVRFSGSGGTFIPSGTQVGAPRAALSDVLLFDTTASGSIPDPGVPTAPAAADHGSGSSLAAGTYEYAVSFATAEGETEIGAISNALVMSSAHSIDLTAIPTGGPGTTARKLYRRLNGGTFGLIHTIADNSTLIYTDATAVLGAAPVADSTAEQLTLPVVSDDVGVDYNVTTNSITSLSNAPQGLSAVTNASALTGGSDQEDIEVFRQNLMQWIANPQSGAPQDLIAWATSINGIDTAAVFKNVNLSGTTALGTTSIRVAGPGGIVPSDDTIAAALTYIESKDLANITILIGGFDANEITGIEVDVALTGTYTLDDVTPAVIAAVEAYINSVPVGATVFVAGISAAVFGAAGVDTVEVVSPSSDVTSTAVQKPTVADDDITVGAI